MSSFGFATRSPDIGKKVVARGLVPAMNFLFTDVVEQIVLPALAKKQISSAKNPQSVIYASPSIRTAWTRHQIEISLDGVVISSWEQLNPAATVALSENLFGAGEASDLGGLITGTAPSTTHPSPGGAGALVGNQVWNETPSGLIDGANDTFTIARVANPREAMLLYKNGVLQKQGDDYNFSGAQILRFAAAAIPSAGDILLASYTFR